ncbi:hypothetical protein GCM10007301_28120 [Azorhizobium oxalatiphilum]|uniref:AbiTii domain-containing protein n=1 Tax=Azorhizobium oxalatiphilum TaxID=980631 RepID=A0A917C159_9HYPH|nr:hypothetical protein [Azorhizobium oxalatiphilum]GGF66841.1 hypothetical protein GCM10007301_28120 [Azorhizobium oxalatiphilum]
MKLLQDIIDQAVDGNAPIGEILRRCLVLERKINNEKFKQWINWELDGYPAEEEPPSYRKFNCVNKGLFVGMTVKMANQPIPMHILSAADRKELQTVELRQPVASYASFPRDNGDAQILWAQSLVAKYQDKFFQGGDPVLNRAWQEIPGSVLVGLVEQVRTRVLRFALDINSEVGADSDIGAVTRPTIERSVVNNFYGGNNIVAEHAENFAVINATQVNEGNLEQLENALAKLGLERAAIEDMKTAMSEDAVDGKPTLGQRTLKWATDGATYVAKEGLKVGVEVAKAEVKRWLLQYTGWGA